MAEIAFGAVQRPSAPLRVELPGDRGNAAGRVIKHGCQSRVIVAGVSGVSVVVSRVPRVLVDGVVGLDLNYYCARALAGASVVHVLIWSILRSEPLVVAGAASATVVILVVDLVRRRGSREQELVSEEARPLARLKHIIAVAVLRGDLEIRDHV